MNRSRIVALASAIVLVAAGLLWAQTALPPADSQPPAAGTGGHSMMGGPMTGEGAEPGSMMGDCRAMMAERQAKVEEREAMDAKLESLVQAMNEARGGKKVDATAAVVTELVAQRRAMHESMTSAHAGMMQHMTKHMRTGMMQGMKESMAGCPMMGEAKPEESGHESHH